MKILAILDDKDQSTFYLYSQKDNSLKRIAPSVEVENNRIGHLFCSMELSDFLEKIKNIFPYDKYIVIPKQLFLEQLLDETEWIEVSNPSDFIHNDVFYKKGKVKLDQKNLIAFFEFNEDNDTFARQEHVFRLATQKVIKGRNPLNIHKEIKRMLSIMKTDITLSSIMKMSSHYVTGTKQKIKKEVILNIIN
ncbi:hypothetical protein [Candidatus Enterococcus courvalinii]|uniref:Transcriptional regulator n=1 Tax=Candidatus Enterococcus courvalinii TaxID=2815329 RepID=A0ABS3I030_9ENTE|nr:hypothetical protein [Enterococcus sp. MSG2901]MBO0481438.1 hypothetical protein [Enterococcus sp. MSG2901]